ncbi:MAG: hypothetical protein LH629_08760 [Ignavibacteria bacterium]|nr:hypothetical protein [Ignavibacteria bacterium]
MATRNQLVEEINRLKYCMNYLKLALQIAKKGRTNKRHHLAAVAIRRDGSLIGRPNVRVQFPSPSAHAEARVLRLAGHGVEVLYVARIMADGSAGLARPCVDCQKAIRKAKVKKVIYTISTDEYGVWYPDRIIQIKTSLL